MISLLENAGSAIWRASWQAAVLALFIALLLRCCGERLAPRWRFLLWSVVVARLLLVVTPVSPWSVFNLVDWQSPAPTSIVAQQPESTTPAAQAPPMSPRADASFVIPTPTQQPTGDLQIPTTAQSTAPSTNSSTPSREAAKAAPAANRFDAAAITRMLLWCWLAGCLLFALRLSATAYVLRRRLSACRPVTDPKILQLFQSCRQRMGLKQAPALLVTPENISPCIVGTWNPRIVLPETVVTEASASRLRHILAHELAHFVRLDLWTNWLLLTSRILHWFNPVAWWTVRQMQAEREAACDELAFATLDETDRSAYAATIVDLAASLAPTGIAPGLVGLFSSTCRLKARIERLLRGNSGTSLRAPIAAAMCLLVALLGLTDAMPGSESPEPTTSQSNATNNANDADDANATVATNAATTQPADETRQPESTDNTYTLSGRCVYEADRKPLARIAVHLYRLDGPAAAPIKIAEAMTDEAGRYVFTGLEPPRPSGHLDRLYYGVFGFSDERPIGTTFFHFRDGEPVVEIRMAREHSTISGRVIDAQGRPVAGATVLRCFVLDRPVPDLLPATTDADGRFTLNKVGVHNWQGGMPVKVDFVVRHPDFPDTRAQADGLPADVTVTMPTGCVVTGLVTDAVTGQPASGAVVTARRDDNQGQSHVATDAAGRFRMVLLEGRYDFLVAAQDRVCVAVTGRECVAGEPLELSPFSLIRGGFIAGRVINSVTGDPIPVADKGQPITIGLIGPSQPLGRAISPLPLATVDNSGRFVLRAAPGENFPYLINIRGERMAWNTKNQPPVIVKDGGVADYNMLITPEVSGDEKMRAARELVAALPADPTERTEQILAEFRKLDATVDHTELWCSLMRELVAIGSDAVPQICAELDQTTKNATLRRLAFALRAIGDPRAVPALIRAYPRTLLPSSSDYGLRVADKELTTFMQQHDLDQGRDGSHFDLGRPVREVIGALHTLTGENLEDSDLFSMSLSDDPRKQILQRRIFLQRAQRWDVWWQANWRKLTDDVAYQTVQLNSDEQPLPPVKDLGNESRLNGVFVGGVMSPAAQGGRHAWHFLDLDTGFRPNWPARLARDESALDDEQLAKWAEETGIDVMCVTHRLPDGTDTYVLRTFGMKVREISAREFRDLKASLANGMLPEGRAVGERLMHFDLQSQQLVADVNAVFLFETREGNLGVIETTDRVTRTADLTGTVGDPPPGVGFHKGVRFNLHEIVP